ncbi:MAG: hypothetical protein IKV05_01265 [Bacteroidales bacterium]|nr:hypothetical protein [Bacteroidales bacterium]
MKKLLTLLTSLALTVTGIHAQIKLPKVLTDNMVLQSGKEVRIWGEAPVGAKVQVEFQKQKKSVYADHIGRWTIILDTLKVSATPSEMVIRCGKEKEILSNILVGEVWLASGQSNMEYSMNNHPKHPKPKRGDRDYLYKAYSTADNQLIRVLHVRKELTDTLPTDGWKVLSQESLAPISAAAYFFADSLSKKLNVPVGIISSAWGGTPIEAWTSVEAYENSPVFENKVSYNRLDGVSIAKRFDCMIAPIVPYTMRGFLWYQGEQNVVQGDTDIYTDKMALLIDDWRGLWKDENMPFYFVQLAPYCYSQRRNDAKAKTWEALPMFWQAQEACLKINNTGMVVTTDLIDKTTEIHPSYKWVVGRRLARLALAKTYGYTDILCYGPTFKSVSFQGGEAIIEMENVGEGLQTNDGKSPGWFQMADKSGRFFDAEAKIIAPNKISVRCKRYDKPLYVRYAWDELASPNLFNSEGLPAVPFGAKMK